MTTDDVLPPLRNLGPLRISRDPLAGHPAYARLLADAARTGSCPVWIGDPDRLLVPDDPHGAVAAIGDADPEAFIADRWTRNCPFCASSSRPSPRFGGAAHRIWRSRHAR